MFRPRSIRFGGEQNKSNQIIITLHNRLLTRSAHFLLQLLAVSGLLASIKRGHVFHPISLGFLGVYILVMSCIEEFTLISTLLQYFFFVTWLNVFYLVDQVRDQSKTRNGTDMILGI